MSYQNVSYVITAKDHAEIMAAFDTLNAKLPFLINLTDEERRALFKMGPKSVDFVQDSAEVTKNFPEIIPPSFDKDEHVRDANLIKHLVTYLLKLDSIQEKTSDTLIAVGNEAMKQSLEVYALVKSQEERIPGLKTISAKLGERFKKSKAKKEAESPLT